MAVKGRKRRAKGTGRVLRAGKTWAIRYTENGERKYAGGYETQDKAREALDVIVAQIKAGLPGTKPQPAGPGARFTDLVDEWMQFREQHDELRSVSDDRVRWKNHLADLLSYRSINTVDESLIADLVTDLKTKRLSGGTIERVLHLLSAFYKWAITFPKLVDRNPVAAYLGALGDKARRKLRSQHKPKDTPFIDDAAHVARVFQALPEPINVAYALSALAGLRPGEVLALEWGDVDLAKGKLHVRRQVRHGHVSAPKSGEGRDVDMVPSLHKVLTGWRQRHPKEVLVCPPLLAKLKDGRMVERRNRHGRAKFLNLRTIYAALSDALKACRLPDMTFYEAGRHTFASLWVLRGLDIYRLSKVMGHSSVKVTERYAHLTNKTPADVLAAADIPLAV